MQIGVIFPQIEFPADPAAVRDYAQAVEGMGFTHVLAYDHVLGANPDRPGGWQGPYTYENPFFEPFLLYTFMAAFTTRLGLTTGIIILPQRQTALVAKQAATLDVLSGGRLRLGVGLGWNPVEYTALGENFHNRGKRIEEQIDVLRKLWTQPLVTYKGKWHTIEDAGVNPLPVQRPIPVWFGGYHDAVLERAARIGDGWMPNRGLETSQPALEKLYGLIDKAGRKRSDVGIEARIQYGDGSRDTWAAALEGWKAAGATHITFDTMRAGLSTPGQHLEALKQMAATAGMG